MKEKIKSGSFKGSCPNCCRENVVVDWEFFWKKKPAFGMEKGVYMTFFIFNCKCAYKQTQFIDPEYFEDGSKDWLDFYIKQAAEHFTLRAYARQEFRKKTINEPRTIYKLNNQANA